MIKAYTKNLKVLRSLEESYNFKWLKLTNKLLKEKRITEDFLDTLTFLSLEELIYLKLESINSYFGGKFVGFNLLEFLKGKVEELVINFAFDNFRKLEHIKYFLGLNDQQFYYILRKHKKDKNGKD
jgi:hypothetical protein